MANITATYARVAPKNRESWRRWLKKHYARTPGVWLVFNKKASGKPSVSYNDAVEEALCFGWIDSVVKRIDDARYEQLFTPRKAKSAWSQPNKERVARMIKARLMTPAGRSKIDAAKRDGSWSALDAVHSLTIPPELKKAFAANKSARDNFGQLSPGKKKVLLYLINNAKRPETRAKRVKQVVQIAESGKMPG